MTDYNPKEYRREKFNKKKKDYQKSHDEYNDDIKKKKQFKQKKRSIEENDDWEEYDELY